MKWIKVSEFCKQEGVSHQGVYAKLNSYRYVQDLKDHVRGYKGKAHSSRGKNRKHLRCDGRNKRARGSYLQNRTDFFDDPSPPT